MSHDELKRFQFYLILIIAGWVAILCKFGVLS